MRRRILWKVDIDKSAPLVYNDNTFGERSGRNDVYVLLLLYFCVGLSACLMDIAIGRKIPDSPHPLCLGAYRECGFYF